MSCEKSAPKCSDSETVEKVKKSVKSKLKGLGLSEKDIVLMKINLEAIRTTATDEKTGRQECACITNIKWWRDL